MFAVTKGFSLTDIMAMDLPSFGCLLNSLHRVVTAQEVKNAITMQIATQGDSKNMKARIKELIGSLDDPEEAVKALNTMGQS